MEQKALKAKVKGHNYDLNDFSFSFKEPPNYKKEFKEIVVKYFYRNEKITYFYFVRKEADNDTAIELAKNKVQEMIESGEILEYAKYFYKNKLYYL